jgi:hypothetical protein
MVPSVLSMSVQQLEPPETGESHPLNGGRRSLLSRNMGAQGTRGTLA